LGSRFTTSTHDTKIYKQSSVSTRNKSSVHNQWFCRCNPTWEVTFSESFQQACSAVMDMGRNEETATGNFSCNNSSSVLHPPNPETGRVSQSVPSQFKGKKPFVVHITEGRTGKEESHPMFHNRNRLPPFLHNYSLLSAQRERLRRWGQGEQAEEDIWPFVLFPRCRTLKKKNHYPGWKEPKPSSMFVYRNLEDFVRKNNKLLLDR